jgi:hypothetical protein
MKIHITLKQEKSTYLKDTFSEVISYKTLTVKKFEETEQDFKKEQVCGAVWKENDKVRDW